MEYRTNPSKRVVVHYQKGESYVDEDMNEMYEGIFVKEFIVFLEKKFRIIFQRKHHGSPL